MMNKNAVIRLKDRLVNLLRKNSDIVPLSKDEKRALNVFNDLINTLVAYIVVLSVVVNVSSLLHDKPVVAVALGLLSFLVIVLITMKWALQLLATPVSRYLVGYLLFVMTLLFLIGIIFALAI